MRLADEAANEAAPGQALVRLAAPEVAHVAPAARRRQRARSIYHYRTRVTSLLRRAPPARAVNVRAVNAEAIYNII